MNLHPRPTPRTLREASRTPPLKEVAASAPLPLGARFRLSGRGNDGSSLRNRSSRHFLPRRGSSLRRCHFSPLPPSGPVPAPRSLPEPTLWSVERLTSNQLASTESHGLIASGPEPARRRADERTAFEAIVAARLLELTSEPGLWPPLVASGELAGDLVSRSPRELGFRWSRRPCRGRGCVRVTEMEHRVCIPFALAIR